MALSGGQADRWSFFPPGNWLIVANYQSSVVKRSRMQILYSGNVQGVGFRYTVKTVATGFEVSGAVRNLPDGRVELIAEGAQEELLAFQQAIRESGLEHFIRDEHVLWDEPQHDFRGFEIVR
jgi:acylphosphatase